jgi:hypothetical protein
MRALAAFGKRHRGAALGQRGRDVVELANPPATSNGWVVGGGIGGCRPPAMS